MARRPSPRRGRWCAPGRRAGLLAVVAEIVVVGIVVAVTAGCLETTSTSSTRGSGVSMTDRRQVTPFTGIELAGANTVVVHVGAPLAVAVTGDDNLVGRVTTVVRGGRLVVDDTGSFTTRAPMSVAVSVPSLDNVELGGTGTVTIQGVASDDFSAQLSGAGTVVAAGTVQRLSADLAGAGTLDLHDLVASGGTVQLRGTGTIRVHATSSIDATLTGTGTIRYGGNPTVTVHNTGTGTVSAER